MVQLNISFYGCGNQLFVDSAFGDYRCGSRYIFITNFYRYAANFIYTRQNENVSVPDKQPENPYSWRVGLPRRYFYTGSEKCGNRYYSAFIGYYDSLPPSRLFFEGFS